MKRIKDADNKKIFIVFILMIFVFSLPKASFANQYELTKTPAGYCYSVRGVCLAEFTEDENYQLPQEIEVAESRFERRKEFVEKWYLENRPQSLEKTNYFVEIPKAIVSIPLFPFLAICEWFEERKQLAPEEIEKQKKNNEIYESKLKRLHDFIVEDCLQEKEAIR